MSEIKDPKANETKPAAKANETKPAAKANETKPAAKANETKPAAKANETKPAAKKVPALKVSSLREGFRRAGRAWTREAQTVKVSELTKGQIAQLKSEPMLAVVETEVDE
jgi:sRNA-binding protein